MIIPRYSVIIANSDLSPEALATMNKPTLFDLTGRVAVITGSSRGIGRAIAERLADQGAKVVVSSRTQSAVDDVAAAINATHGAGTAIAVAANISSKDDLVRLVERTREAFSKIDILVCNAATNVHFGRCPLSRTSSSAKSWTTTSCPTTGSSSSSLLKWLSVGTERSLLFLPSVECRVVL